MQLRGPAPNVKSLFCVRTSLKIKTVAVELMKNFTDSRRKLAQINRSGMSKKFI